MNNWQRKSDYLLREIIKFQTYSDSLAAAQSTKEEVYRRKARQEEVMGRVGTSNSGGAKVEGSGNVEAEGRGGSVGGSVGAAPA